MKARGGGGGEGARLLLAVQMMTMARLKIKGIQIILGSLGISLFAFRIFGWMFLSNCNEFKAAEPGGFHAGLLKQVAIEANPKFAKSDLGGGGILG